METRLSLLSPQQAQKQANGEEEADPGGPEVAEDARADAVVEDADRSHGRGEQQLDRQYAVHLADKACVATQNKNATRWTIQL